MAWWHRTGLLEPEDLGCHTDGVPSAAWTSAGEVVGHRKTPSHRDTLPDDSVKKARDKAVTPN